MRACAPPAAAALSPLLPRRRNAPQAPPGTVSLNFSASRRRRCALRPCRSTSGDAESNTPWWMALDELYVLTFDAGSEDEGIYTTSSSAADGTARNAFVAFQDASAAGLLAKQVAVQAGRACAVQSVPPLALLLLGREAGYTVDAVPRGMPWTTPDILLLEDDSDSQTAAAQRAAAAAVRSALLLPMSRLSASMARAAGLPAGSTLQQQAPGEDETPALPHAASAMATALRAIARRRLEALLPRADDEV